MATTIDRIFTLLSDNAFKVPNTGLLFFPAYIYTYPPKEEYLIRQQIEILNSQLQRPSNNLNCLVINIYEEFITIVKKDIESRFLDYFNSPMFESVREGIDENTGQFIGYAPNFVIAQIFSNNDTLRDIIENPTNKNKYDEFYKEGWNNFQDFIMNKDFSEIEDTIVKEKLDFMKRFVEGYIQNGYKPLSRMKYDEIKENLPY